MFQAPFNKLYALNDSGSKQIDDYEEALKEVTQLIYSGDKVEESDIAEALTGLQEVLANCRVQR